MAEKPPENHPHSFFPFWRKAIKEGWDKSREKFGLVVDITLALTAIGLLLGAWISKRHPDFNTDRGEAIMSYWLALIPAGLWLIWFGWHVLKAPHEIYMGLYDKYQTEIGEKNSKIQQKESEIESLTQKLAEKSAADKLVTDRQFAKKLLGERLLELQQRLYEAKQISRYEFVDDLQKKEWEATNLIFNAIDRHLDVLLTSAEVAFFRDARPQPLPDPQRYDFLTEREQQWQWHINFITARKDELKKILERLG